MEYYKGIIGDNYETIFKNGLKVLQSVTKNNFVIISDPINQEIVWINEKMKNEYFKITQIKDLVGKKCRDILCQKMICSTCNLQPDVDNIDISIVEKNQCYYKMKANAVLLDFDNGINKRFIVHKLEDITDEINAKKKQEKTNKKLNFLIDIGKITRKNNDVDYTLQNIVNILADFFEYSEKIGVIISFNGKEYKNGIDFKLGNTNLKVPIIDENGKNLGDIIVFYKENETNKELFSLQEISVIENVAERIISYFIRKKNEFQLLEDTKKAQEANRKKSDFLSHMSHEIRTPLNAIINFIEIILNTPLTEIQKEYLQIAINSSKHLLRIINDILDYSKIEAGKMEIEKINFDINELVEDILPIIGTQINIQNKEILLIPIINDNVPNFLIGDSTRIKQIIINLLNNAVKFTNKGEIIIELDYIEDNLIINISDTGIGMTSKEIEKICNPFIQADSSTNRKYGGTGLGLFICSKIVELMGGKMNIESTQGKGSNFNISIPAIIGSEKNIDNNQHNEEELNEQILKGTKILLAEDNVFNQKVAQIILSSKGAEITIVNNGEEAVEMFKKEQFDIILMDLLMPEMDGLEATKRIREFNKETPIIPMTANVTQEDQKKCEECGMNSFLSKPIDSQKLFDTILDQLQQKDPRQPIKLNKKINSNQLIKVFDIKDFLDRMSGNKELLKILIEVALKNDKDGILYMIEDIKKDFSNNDLKTLMLSSHKLKGMSANLSAYELREIASKIEEGAKKNNLEEITKLIPNLEKAWERLEIELKNF